MLTRLELIRRMQAAAFALALLMVMALITVWTQGSTVTTSSPSVANEHPLPPTPAALPDLPTPPPAQFPLLPPPSQPIPDELPFLEPLEPIVPPERLLQYRSVPPLAPALWGNPATPSPVKDGDKRKDAKIVATESVPTVEPTASSPLAESANSQTASKGAPSKDVDAPVPVKDAKTMPDASASAADRHPTPAPGIEADTATPIATK